MIGPSRKTFTVAPRTGVNRESSRVLRPMPTLPTGRQAAGSSSGNGAVLKTLHGKTVP